MNTTDAAIEVLRREGGGPIYVRDLARLVIESGMVQLAGKTPVDSISSKLYVEARKADARVKRVGPMFRLSVD